MAPCTHPVPHPFIPAHHNMEVGVGGGGGGGLSELHLERTAHTHARTHARTHTHTNKQTQRQTDRQRQRETETETQRETETERIPFLVDEDVERQRQRGCHTL